MGPNRKKNKQEPIKTQQVFTEYNQVFAKEVTGDWFPIPFQWVPLIK
ncbi:hypothetical protein [uncultured Croceitalea sp.]